MSILSLARFQFAMTTIFHFFFVPFSIGMVFMVALMETCYVRTKNEAYKKMTKFWGNIFLLSFAVGVVTGLIQEFQFGMNWSDYSRFMGDIFGAPLAMEALLSFFIESTFIGLWMFTWDRVKPGLHLFFVWMVVIGTMTSALWILTANSFMQHPVGYTIRNGRAEMTSFSALLRNPQVWYEWGHVISGAIMMGGIVVAGMAAFRLLKRKSLSEVSKDIFKRSMRLGMIVSLLGSLSVMGVGDLQMKDLLHTQPMKFSAMEALYKDTGKSAGWTVVGIADTKNHKTNYTIEIPGMLSVLSYGKTTGSVKGMDTINKELQAKYGTKNNYYVPVNTLFFVSALGLFFTRKKKASLFNTNWMLWVVALMTFTPFLANTCGWLITELGRYPWTVYGLFTIAQSVSPSVSATSLLISNILYFAIFTVLAIVMVGFVVKELRKGPDEASEPEFAKHGLDPFDKEAF